MSRTRSFFAKERSLHYEIIGEILKRPTRADCKSADYVFAGSNPALPTKESLMIHQQIIAYPNEMY
jgi:hypothetical protein